MIQILTKILMIGGFDYEVRDLCQRKPRLPLVADNRLVVETYKMVSESFQIAFSVDYSKAFLEEATGFAILNEMMKEDNENS